MDILQDEVAAGNGSPSEAFLKLVLPFLEAKRDLIQTADLVCKDWHCILQSDDVWRPVCDRKLAWHKMVHGNRKANSAYILLPEKEYYTKEYEILATQMKKRTISDGNMLRILRICLK